MLVKSFVLRRESYCSIVEQCSAGTIAVIRPEKALETLFRELVHKVVVEKLPAQNEIKHVKSYLDDITGNSLYLQKKQEFVDYVQEYLNGAAGYNVDVTQVEDYVLAQCAILCAQAVACSVNVNVIDGRELVVCKQEGVSTMFDWTATPQRN